MPEKVTTLYLRVVAVLVRRIRALGWTMRQCDDRSGNEDGYSAKCLHPNTPSGRQARWETLQNLIDALYPAGFKVKIEALPATDPRMLKRLSRSSRTAVCGLLTFARST